MDHLYQSNDRHSFLIRTKWELRRLERICDSFREWNEDKRTNYWILSESLLKYETIRSGLNDRICECFSRRETKKMEWNYQTRLSHLAIFADYHSSFSFSLWSCQWITPVLLSVTGSLWFDRRDEIYILKCLRSINWI